MLQTFYKLKLQSLHCLSFPIITLFGSNEWTIRSTLTLKVTEEI